MTEQQESLLTPKVKALIGQASEVTQMYGEVDQESIRRHAIGIPDQDPLHWDEKAAKPRFGGVTSPIYMVTYIARRSPPWEHDRMDEITQQDWFNDTGGGMERSEKGLPEVSEVAGTHSLLHTGDEMEVLCFPKVGDKIYYQAKYSEIKEMIGRRGERQLYVTRETRYWNQNNETICFERMTLALRK